MMVLSDLLGVPGAGDQPNAGHWLVVIEKTRSNRDISPTFVQLKGGQGAAGTFGAAF